MAINVELRKSDGNTYAGAGNLIYMRTEVALVDGLLLEGKIDSQFLPSYIFGGLKYAKTISADGTLQELTSPIVTDVNKELARGNYFICAANITVTPIIGNMDGDDYVIYSGDEDSGSPTAPTKLEAGDWLVYRDYNIKDGGLGIEFIFDVINNTYQDATSSSKGIVRLATDADGTSGTDTTKAMTPKATVAAINARAYSHPTHTAKNETFSAVETLSALSVNSLGHVTSFSKQAIRVASEAQTGVIRLASSSEAKAATDDTKATSPLRVKEMIDKFASIELVQSLPTNMTDHPAGKLIMLQL